MLVQISFGLLVQLHESSSLFIGGIHFKSASRSYSFMLVAILVQTVLGCIIKIHLSIFLDDSISARRAHDDHALVSVGGSSCLLLITPEVASTRPLSDG